MTLPPQSIVTAYPSPSSMGRVKSTPIASLSYEIMVQRMDRIRQKGCLSMAPSDDSDDRRNVSGTTVAVSERNKGKQGKNNYNNNRNMGEKQRVRTMFRQAKEMERTGQWRQACIHLEKILEIDPQDSYSHLALARLRSKREKTILGEELPSFNDEKKTVTSSSGVSSLEETQIDITPLVMSQTSSSGDSRLEETQIDIITPLVISQTQPFSKARQAFFHGTEMCPNSIHIWQAWALHEDSLGNISYAKSLFQKALKIDETNPYVCHGYGLLEHRCGNFNVAMELWQRPLKSRQKGKTTAALVTSIGKLRVAKGELNAARDLYMQTVLRRDSQREATEVYLAAAWLEEKHFKNLDRAEELLKVALRISPGNSRTMVALARLEGRRIDSERVGVDQNASNGKSKKGGEKKDVARRRDDAVKEQLQDACSVVKGQNNDQDSQGKNSDVKDGRLYNAWAKLEVKDRNFDAAKDILRQGMEIFPDDHSVSSSMTSI